MYDITDGDSLDRVRKWIQELKNHASDDIVIAIAGNKIDLEKRRHVKKDDALALAKTVGATHFDTSAKLNKGLQDAFLHLARGLLRGSGAGGGGGLGDGNDGGGTQGAKGKRRGGRNARNSRVLRIREDSEDFTDSSSSNKKGGCC